MEEARLWSLSPEENLLIAVSLVSYFPQGAVKSLEGVLYQDLWISYVIPSSHCDTIITKRHNKISSEAEA